MSPTPPSTTPNTLANKIILITGASGVIGRCASLTFAQLGASVILLGRNLKKLEAVYDTIEAAGGPQPAIYELNLQTATPHHYENLAAAMEAEFGRIDGVLHNAAELGKLTSLRQYSPEVWQRVMQVNVTAPFLLTRALLPLLQKSSAGRLVFTGSGVGRKGRAYWGAYAVSKAATENLMQVWADELEDTPIRVNSINPGATRTAMRAGAYPAENPLILKTPEDIMPTYVYLFSDSSGLVHGQQLDAQ